MFESGIVVSFAVGLLALLLTGKIIGTSISLLTKFMTNSIFGAFLLIIANFFGFSIEITILKALFCGIFGVPGVIVLVIWERFM